MATNLIDLRLAPLVWFDKLTTSGVITSLILSLSKGSIWDGPPLPYNGHVTLSSFPIDGERLEPALSNAEGMGMLGFMMRWLLLTGGPLMSLIGIVWILQGIGQLGGSPMTGQLFWAWAGLVALIAGLGILYIGIRRRDRPPG